MSDAKKHTPGPWNTSAYDGGWDCIRDGSGQIIAKLGANNPANADLIAAAPDMLAALKTAHHRMGNIGCDYDRDDDFKQVCDAIAKAE